MPTKEEMQELIDLMPHTSIKVMTNGYIYLLFDDGQEAMIPPGGKMFIQSKYGSLLVGHNDFCDIVRYLKGSDLYT